MRFIWVLVFTLVALLEGVSVGSPAPGDTLSEAVWFVRYDAVGPFVILPLWTWLTWHWFLKPDVTAGWQWQDLAAALVGLAWALWSVRR